MPLLLLLLVLALLLITMTVLWPLLMLGAGL